MKNDEINKFDYEEIRNRILEYTKAKDYNYALLIKGEWGIGKTYFIQKDILKNINDSINPIYISLFGINTISELNEIVSTEILFKLCDKKEICKTKIGRVGKIIGKTALNIALKKLAISKEDLFLPSEIRDLVITQGEKKFLFIFDDLERTSCNMKDLLGFINSFVEQYGAKVLIIGDINKLGTCENVLEKNTNKFDTKKEKTTIVDEDEKKLFSYYKEKLIGFDINYNPNFNDVINSFVNSLFDLNNIEDYLDITKTKLRNLLISLFNGIEEKNLRKLQRIIFLINQLIKELKSIEHEEKIFTQEYKAQFFIISIIKIFLITFGLKDIYELQSIPEEWKILVQYTKFLYIKQFVSSSIIKEVEINNDIKMFINERKWEEENKRDPLLILKKSYHILKSDTELKEKYEKMINQIENYIPKQIPDLLILVSQLEKNNLINNGELKRIIELTDSKIKSLKNFNTYDIDFEFYFSDKGLPKEHKKIIDEKTKEWKEISKSKRKDNISDTISKYLQQKDMIGLKEYLNRNQIDIININSVLGNVNFNVIKEFLEESNAEQYQEFRAAIYQIYPDKNIIKNHSEQEIIKKIIDWCNNNLDQNQDKIILMQKRWLIKNFEKLII